MSPETQQPEAPTVAIDSVSALSKEQPKYTRKQIKQARRQYFTVRQGKVSACGHKFHPVNEPDTNCADCWEAFFRVHEGFVAATQSIIASFGEAALVKARGTKFVKQYKKFAAMVEEEQRNEVSV